MNQTRTVQELSLMHPDIRILHYDTHYHYTPESLLAKGIWACHLCGHIQDLVNAKCSKCDEEKYILTVMDKNLFGEPVQEYPHIPNNRRKTNPCLSAFGHGPDGERCKNCVHFIRKEYSKTYFKCEFRGNTNGPGTDHRANWPACGKFEKITT